MTVKQYVEWYSKHFDCNEDDIRDSLQEKILWSDAAIYGFVIQALESDPRHVHKDDEIMDIITTLERIMGDSDNEDEAAEYAAEWYGEGSGNDREERQPEIFNGWLANKADIPGVQLLNR